MSWMINEEEMRFGECGSAAFYQPAFNDEVWLLSQWLAETT